MDTVIVNRPSLVGLQPSLAGCNGCILPRLLALHTFSTFRNRRTIPRHRRLPPTKTAFVILELTGDLSTREQTSHLHRSIPKHCPARLGLHEWPAAREIRFVVHRPVPVLGRFAHRPR